LFNAGNHVPVIGVALVDDVGSGDNVAPEQIAATALNVGVSWHTVTVNVADVVAVWHALVAVHVTVTVPPVHANGADAGALLLSVAPAHPPLIVTLANHAVYAVLIAACVWHPFCD
jgi:hypothetical protein